jgi:hypothetical protein
MQFLSSVIKNRLVLFIPIVLTFFVLKSQAADIFKVESYLNRGSSKLDDAGNLTITSNHVFEQVPSSYPQFPRDYIRGTLNYHIYDNPSYKRSVAHVFGFLFLRGSFYTNRTSFPGVLKYKNGSGQTVASIDEDGNFYIKGNLYTSTSCTPPPYEPNLWNDQDDVQMNNNCYNYGNNQITYSYAQPGRAAGYPEWSDPSDMNVTYVRERALADGLNWVGWSNPGSSYTCPGGGHLVFMAIAIDEDYHWWRKDNSTGRWSHKPAQGQATDKDGKGLLISDPLQSDRNIGIYNYSENGGFYCTCGNNANAR